MTLAQALLVVAGNQHLIGKKFKGGIIDDLLILPKNSQQKDLLLIEYITTADSGRIQALIPDNTDVEIMAICDRHLIKSGGVLFQINIRQLPSEFEVEM